MRAACVRACVALRDFNLVWSLPMLLAGQGGSRSGRACTNSVVPLLFQACKSVERDALAQVRGPRKCSVEASVSRWRIWELLLPGAAVLSSLLSSWLSSFVSRAFFGVVTEHLHDCGSSAVFSISLTLVLRAPTCCVFRSIGSERERERASHWAQLVADNIFAESKGKEYRE